MPIFRKISEPQWLRLPNKSLLRPTSACHISCKYGNRSARRSVARELNR